MVCACVFQTCNQLHPTWIPALTPTPRPLLCAAHSQLLREVTLTPGHSLLTEVTRALTPTAPTPLPEGPPQGSTAAPITSPPHPDTSRLVVWGRVGRRARYPALPHSGAPPSSPTHGTVAATSQAHTMLATSHPAPPTSTIKPRGGDQAQAQQEGAGNSMALAIPASSTIAAPRPVNDAGVAESVTAGSGEGVVRGGRGPPFTSSQGVVVGSGGAGGGGASSLGTPSLSQRGGGMSREGSMVFGGGYSSWQPADSTLTVRVHRGPAAMDWDPEGTEGEWG